ncbi:MAG: hypothetical protein KDM81_22875, partial [Verrucomicrobiae bacterium]|nr:hypothetical protein [Verrucomicrobiae bacterium]
MTLRLPAFEKALRRRVRAEVRKSRVLRRQARRARRRWWLNPAWLAFGYGAFLIGALVTKIAPAGHEFAARMAVVCLWFLGTLATNSAALAATLGDGARNWCLQLLPFGDTEVFRIQWRQHVRSSSWWLLFYAPFAVSLVAPRITDWRLLLAGVGFLLLQALCARAIV